MMSAVYVRRIKMRKFLLLIGLMGCVIGFEQGRCSFLEREQETLRQEVTAKTGYRFKNLSHLNDSLQVGTDSFRKLEILGDAILYKVVTECLFDYFSTVQSLHEARESYKTNENLSRVFMNLGMTKNLRQGQSTLALTENLNHFWGSALEALIGAVHKDSGNETASKAVIHTLFPNLPSQVKLSSEPSSSVLAASLLHKAASGEVKSNHYYRDQLSKASQGKKILYKLNGAKNEVVLWINSTNVLQLPRTQTGSKKKVGKADRERLAKTYLDRNPGKILETLREADAILTRGLPTALKASAGTDHAAALDHLLRQKEIEPFTYKKLQGSRYGLQINKTKEILFEVQASTKGEAKRLLGEKFLESLAHKS